MQLLSRFFLPAVRNSSAARVRPSPHDDGEQNGALEAAAAACAQGRYADAFASINAALTAKPGNRELLFARASTLFSWGRYRESRDGLLALERSGQTGAPFWLKLGWACFWTGEVQEAESWMRKAVEAEPEDWSTHFGLGTVLDALKKTEESRDGFRRALELNPDDPYCIANLLSAETELENVQTAESLARRAVELDPDSPVAWSNLGVVLDHQERYTEAIDAFRHADELSSVPGGVQYDFVCFAVCMLRAGRTREGIDFLERKLAQMPSVQGHSHYALSLLLAGRMAEGWEQCEFRWIDGPLKKSRFDFALPAWEGQDLQGKTVLLRAEQGHGDFIQFIRYARHVKAQGATVLIHLPEAVRKLCQYVDGIDHVLVPDVPFPRVDYYANLMSLPRVFGTDLDSIPAEIPYIRVDGQLTAAWNRRFAHVKAPKIGLAWAGSPTHSRDKLRSIPLTALAPLLEEKGVQFFSLQKGPAVEQLRAMPAALDMIDLEPDLNDFVDTAAAISQLDLVLCVDTAVAHLAGALGKPVWLMLPTPNDWRWLEGRGDSPWYPTMRLFRQAEIGDWSSVIESATSALRDFVSATSNGARSAVKAAERSRLPEARLVPTDVASRPHGELTVATHARVGVLQYWPNQVPLGRSIRHYGEYLQPQLDLLGRMVLPGSTVMEVGSGIGAHAVFLGKLVGPTGHLFIYEPRPVIQSVLRQNLGSNAVTNITIMKTAVQGPDGFERADALANESRTALPSHSGVSSETIDALALETLNCLKINEHDDPVGVLNGATETLWRHRPLVFSSAVDAPQLAELAECARRCSYRTWRMDVPLFNPANFTNRSDNVFGREVAIALLAVPEEIEADISLDACVEVR